MVVLRASQVMKGKSSISSECMAGDGLNRELTMVPRMASASQSKYVRYVLIHHQVKANVCAMFYLLLDTLEFCWI